MTGTLRAFAKTIKEDSPSDVKLASAAQMMAKSTKMTAITISMQNIQESLSKCTLPSLQKMYEAQLMKLGDKLTELLDETDEPEKPAEPAEADETEDPEDRDFEDDDPEDFAFQSGPWVTGDATRSLADGDDTDI